MTHETKYNPGDLVVIHNDIGFYPSIKNVRMNRAGDVIDYTNVGGIEIIPVAICVSALRLGPSLSQRDDLFYFVSPISVGWVEGMYTRMSLFS